MPCPVKVVFNCIKSNTIELTVHISCYWVLDFLCVTGFAAHFGIVLMIIITTTFSHGYHARL